MALLLDTHILLWLMDDNPRLTDEAKTRIVAAAEVYVSAASIWEIAIKSGAGRLDANAERLVALTAQAGLLELPVTFKHAAASARLPKVHRDPFDRLLVAQAVSEQMRLLTSDAQLCAYSELVEYV